MVVRTSVEENKENETVTQNICDEREKESRGGETERGGSIQIQFNNYP